MIPPDSIRTEKMTEVATRVKRPDKPDRSKLDAQINTLKDQVNKCFDKMTELKTTIDGIKEGRKGQGSATSEPRNKLIALRTELKGLYVSHLDTEPKFDSLSTFFCLCLPQLLSLFFLFLETNFFFSLCRRSKTELGSSSRLLTPRGTPFALSRRLFVRSANT